MAFALFVQPAPVSAIEVTDTYYVSPSGDDDSGNGSIGSPWHTIGYAVGQATGGDTIKVMDDNNASTDDYTENITVNKSLTIERYDSDGTAPQVKAASSSSHVFNITANGVTIKGLDIYGATDSGKAGIYLNGRTGCAIQNNRCGWDGTHKNYLGIYLESSSNNTISGNTCDSNSHDGIYLYLSSNNNTVSGNTCDSNTYYGIYLYTSSSNTVSCNTCSSNTSAIFVY